MAHPDIDSLFCDTSYFYALLDSRDDQHDTAVFLSEQVEQYQIPLFVSWEIVQETVTLLRYRHSFEGARMFIDQILPSLNILIVNNEERRQALDRFKERGIDRELSMCDIISHVLVTGQLSHSPCLAFDDDFEAMGLTVLRNL